MFSRVFSIDVARVLVDACRCAAAASRRRVCGDVPGLAHARAAVDRLELVAPDRAAEDLADEAGRARLPRDAAVVLELDRPCWWSSRGRRASSSCRTCRRASRAAAAVLASCTEPEPSISWWRLGIGEQGEDRFGRRGDHALDGFDVAGVGHGRQRTLRSHSHEGIVVMHGTRNALAALALARRASGSSARPRAARRRRPPRPARRRTTTRPPRRRADPRAAGPARVLLGAAAAARRRPAR